MGTYNSAVITNGGQSMIAQSVAGASLEFTTIKTSDYTYPAGTNLAALTTINSIKQTKDITGATVYNSRVIKVSAAVDNTGLSTAYAINTIGIYAKVGSAAETLFAVVTASAADTMPAYSNKPYSYIYEVNLTMQNAANVTVTVNSAGLVNVSDLNAAKVEIRGEIDDLKSQIDEIDNILDIDYLSDNMWNPSEAVADKAISNVTATLGELVDSSGYTTSGFISAIQGNVIRWDYANSVVSEGTLLLRGTTVLRFAEYDNGKNCLLVTSSWETLPYTVQNTSTKYIRVSVATKPINSIIFGDSSTAQVEYEKYGKDSSRLADLESNIDAVRNMTILSQNIERDIRTYITTSDKVGDTYPKGRIGDTHPLSYTISTNRHIYLSILPTDFLSSVTFTVNPTSAQWGRVMVIADDKGYGIKGFSTTDIEADNTDYITWDNSTRVATVDVTALKMAYPYADALWISSRAEAGIPSVTLTNQANISDFKWLVNDVAKNGANLVLPSKIPAVVGLPTWIYFENVLSSGFLKDYTVTTEASLLTRREAFKYIPSGVGSNVKTVTVLDKSTAINSDTVSIDAVAKEDAEVRSVKVLCIGDSKTEATGKRVEVNALTSEDDYLNVTFIGTRGSSPTLSEGYSGTNIIDLCQSATLGTAVNIFYDSSMVGDNKFNFSQGISAIGEVPNIVFIDFGANQYGMSWDTLLSCYETVIDSIQSYNANIKIVICVQESTSLSTKTDYTQGNKIAYGYGQQSTFYSIGHMIDAFDGRENENVFLCPQYLCIDLYKDFPLALLPVSECNSMRDYLCVDAVHPGTNINSWNATVQYAMYAYTKRNNIPYAAVQASVGVDPAEDDGTYWTPIINPEAGYKKIGNMYYAIIKHLVSN